MSGEDPFAIEVEDLHARLSAGEPVAVLDLREAWERDICALAGSLAIPMNELPARIAEVPKDRPVAVLCHHGVRSAHATRWLRQQGFDNTVNLAGGIDAWARRIDSSMKVY